MILQELLALHESVQDAALDAFRSFTRSPQMKSYADKFEPEKKGASVEFGIRDWGKWQVPEGEEDDGDYDWEEPTPATVKAAEELIKACEKRFPNVKFRLSTEEKNWIHVEVQPK